MKKNKKLLILCQTDLFYNRFFKEFRNNRNFFIIDNANSKISVKVSGVLMDLSGAPDFLIRALDLTNYQRTICIS